MAFHYKQCTIQYAAKTDGTPATGYVEFTPNAKLMDTTEGIILNSEAVVGHLDETGKVTVSLLITDDAAITPTGWSWMVQEKIENGGTWWFQLPDSLSAPVDLRTLYPLGSAPPVIIEQGTPGVPGAPGPSDHGLLTGLDDDDHPQYQRESEKGQANGYAPLGSDTKVPSQYLPAVVAPVSDHGSLTGLSDPDHPISAVQGLQPALDGKSSTSHTHTKPSYNLNELTDVNTVGAVNEKVLGYLDGVWVPVTGGTGGGGGTSDHGELIGLHDDDHPQYPTMVNQDAAPAPPVDDRPALWWDTDAVADELGTVALGDLTDVDTTGATDGNVLGYAGGIWLPVAGEVRVTRPNIDDRLVEVWNGSAWSVVDYDSGWRSLAGTGMFGTLNYYYIRRTGQTIDFRLSWTATANGDADPIGVLPSGFKAGCANATSAAFTLGASKIWGTSAASGNWGIYDVTAGATYYATIHLTTDDAIPTSLPGTLVSPAPA